MNDIQQWAQALLAFDNLRFVVIDTTSIKKDSDILRVLVMDKEGKIRERVTNRSLRYPSSPNTEYTGISQQELDESWLLATNWGTISNQLRGCFVLAYGFDWLQERLDENAEFYGLKPVHMIGDCLMQTAVKYFRSTNYGMKLQDACARIGHTLPARPNAEQRARGQLALLKAMAEGRTSAPAPTPSSDEDEGLGDLDEAIF